MDRYNRQPSIRNWIEEILNNFYHKNLKQINNILFKLVNQEINNDYLQRWDSSDLDQIKQQRQCQSEKLFIVYCQNLITWFKDYDSKKEKVDTFKYFSELCSSFNNYLKYIDSNEEDIWWSVKITNFHFSLIKKFYQNKLDVLTPDSIQILKQLYKSSVKQNNSRFSIYLLNKQIYVLFNLSLYQAVEALTHINLEQYSVPKSDKIIFNYYRGRMNIFKSLFTEAQKCLEQAFQMCQKNDYMQKKKILKYLIPVNIFCGKMPSSQLMSHFQLFEYVAISQAVIQGNLKALASDQDKYKKIWIKRGLYLMLDKLKLICTRNLFKNVWQIIKESKEDQQFKIPLSYFHQAYDFSSKQSSDEKEIACILGNLFYMKFMKGYIFNTNTVVLSKNDPFPKISVVVEKLSSELFL